MRHGRPNLRIRSSAGFSLADVMVGMAISLIGMIVVLQAFTVSENIRRTTIGSGDAQQNGAASLFALERELRQGGYGINTAAYLGCAILAYDELRPAPGTFIFGMTPAAIAPAAGSEPDTITVTYSSAAFQVAPSSLTQNMPSAAAVYKVDSRYGFTPGDLVVAAEVIGGAPTCVLAQVTGLPGAPGQSDNIIHNSGNYQDANGNNVPARYNRPSGLGVSFSANGKLFNLGAQPASNTYSLQPNGQLLLSSPITNSSMVIADGIVQMKAQYGKDTDDDGAVDIWDALAPSTPAGWAQILAVRLAVVARNAQPQRPGAGRACDATTVFPAWAGGVLDLSGNIGLPAGDDWKCYRYKTFQTTVPLRNLLWRP